MVIGYYLEVSNYPTYIWRALDVDIAFLDPSRIRNGPLQDSQNILLCESSKQHWNSVVTEETTESVISQDKQESVALQLNSQSKKQILDKLRNITPIIKLVIFYGQQDIPLRLNEFIGMTVHVIPHRRI